MFENGQIAVFEGKCRQFPNLPKVLSLTLTRKFYQFGRKRFQKKRKDLSYQFL